ncbi:hypothetical protein [Saccharothrix luteola]|uniref:hypothetical protein n=1 Tax=Saccharothrix luteola TaxID=2893018 RepID=UPI001E60DC9D|nr:hypothetical protein [Saccharothrix luteola]MCC8247636.1 hypothetical protein [Saccharothrix luteola]
MSGFFQELAKKLAERWVGLLLVPGALFVVAAVLGLHLGHGHALDWTRAARHLTDRAAAVGKLSGGGQASVVVGLLIAASAVGLVVQAMAGVTRRVFLGTWPWPLTPLVRWRTGRRRTRWHRRVAKRRELEREHPSGTRTAAQQRAVDRAAARVNALAMAEPGSATWMGDRVHAVEAVARNRYGLDLIFAWPRLWLVLPETTRAEITTTHASFAAGIAVAAWAWPLFALGVRWWPAFAVGLVVGATGWARARGAVTDLTALSEAAVDLHGRDLGIALGVVEEGAVGPLTPEHGARITSLVRKGR